MEIRLVQCVNSRLFVDLSEKTVSRYAWLSIPHRAWVKEIISQLWAAGFVIMYSLWSSFCQNISLSSGIVSSEVSVSEVSPCSWWLFSLCFRNSLAGLDRESKEAIISSRVVYLESQEDKWYYCPTNRHDFPNLFITEGTRLEIEVSDNFLWTSFISILWVYILIEFYGLTFKEMLAVKGKMDIYRL